MPNQCAATNLSAIIRLLPEAPPQDRIDPVPAMGREPSLLRIELERLRAPLRSAPPQPALFSRDWPLGRFSDPGGSFRHCNCVAVGGNARDNAG
jgi:hypothetical protein